MGQIIGRYLGRVLFEYDKGLLGIDLSDSDVILDDADIKSHNFSNSNLKGVSMQWALAQHAIFEEATLDDVVLIRADLRGANLNKVKAHNTDFRLANLSQITKEDKTVITTAVNGEFIAARFNAAKCVGANFEHTHFVDVCFWNAKLNDANLRHATFEKCDFGGAIMEGADIEYAKFSDCIFDEGTLSDVLNIESAEFYNSRPVEL